MLNIHLSTLNLGHHERMAKEAKSIVILLLAKPESLNKECVGLGTHANERPISIATDTNDLSTPPPKLFDFPA
jgi:hypothetical protein